MLNSLGAGWPEYSQRLVQGGRKGAAGLKASFKKYVPQADHPSKAQLRELGVAADAFAGELSEMSSRRRIIEARLSELVFDLYGLTKDERALCLGYRPRLACRSRVLLLMMLRRKADDEEAAQESPQSINDSLALEQLEVLSNRCRRGTGYANSHLHVPIHSVEGEVGGRDERIPSVGDKHLGMEF